MSGVGDVIFQRRLPSRAQSVWVLILLRDEMVDEVSV